MKDAREIAAELTKNAPVDEDSEYSTLMYDENTIADCIRHAQIDALRWAAECVEQQSASAADEHIPDDKEKAFEKGVDDMRTNSSATLRTKLKELEGGGK